MVGAGYERLKDFVLAQSSWNWIAIIGALAIIMVGRDLSNAFMELAGGADQVFWPDPAVLQGAGAQAWTTLGLAETGAFADTIAIGVPAPAEPLIGGPATRDEAAQLYAAAGRARSLQIASQIVLTLLCVIAMAFVFILTQMHGGVVAAMVVLTVAVGAGAQLYPLVPERFGAESPFIDALACKVAPSVCLGEPGTALSSLLWRILQIVTPDLTPAALPIHIAFVGAAQFFGLIAVLSLRFHLGEWFTPARLKRRQTLLYGAWLLAIVVMSASVVTTKYALEAPISAIADKALREAMAVTAESAVLIYGIYMTTMLILIPLPCLLAVQADIHEAARREGAMTPIMVLKWREQNALDYETAQVVIPVIAALGPVAAPQALAFFSG